MQADHDIDDDDFDGIEEKSKSQLKREMHELQELGEALVKLSDKELKKIPLPEELVDPIMLARRITANSGKRRQQGNVRVYTSGQTPPSLGQSQPRVLSHARLCGKYTA